MQQATKTDRFGGQSGPSLQHIGFILDGNRRWAREKGIPEYDGHLAGYAALKEVLEAAYDRGIQYVTVYAFSTENWQRTESEISGIMKLAMRILTKDLGQLVKKGVRVQFLGRRQGLDPKFTAAIEAAEVKTQHLTKGTLGICFNYGGQQEIVDAVRQCLAEGMTPHEIDETTITAHLYAPNIPALDMLVRTSGEQRISNFMLWRATYSELFFIDKYWPDMTKEDVDIIIEEYNRRSRRFGG